MYVLSGDDVYRKEQFTVLNKTYKLYVLWGITTDTYDLLGVPYNVSGNKSASKDIKDELTRWNKTFEQAYPPYSSKPVNGQPLWNWAREGRISEIDIPTKEVTIYSVQYHSDDEISPDRILDTIQYRCSIVSGDFRQNEIEQAWREQLERTESTFQISHLTITCSSGTYMRSLAYELGQRLECGACAYLIKRFKLNAPSPQ
jgi:tRNA pseudouridine55 synthase